MGIKKFKKKLLKNLEKAKDFLKDQSFYLKNLGRSIKDTAKLTFKLTSVLILVLLASFSANILHEKYIESKVGDSTVFIRSPQGASHQGMATGFEVKGKSGKIYTLTNAHVCGLQKDGLVMIQDKLNSGRLIPRRVLEVYQENDLCLVEGMDNYQALDLADSLDVGDLVTSVGYPLGQAMNISSGRVKSFGKVTILEPEVKAEDCNGAHEKVITINTIFGPLEFCSIERYAAQTDVPTFPGNSGSPLVNIYGNVVGIMFASDNETHWGDAVDLTFIKDLLKAY